MRLSWTEILLIVAVILLLFGGRKIPELMRGFGQGIKEFKKAANGTTEDAEAAKPAADDKK